jgi:hypothetical protein
MASSLIVGQTEELPTPALPATRFARGGREMPGVTPDENGQTLIAPFPPRSGGEGTGGGR